MEIFNNQLVALISALIFIILAINVVLTAKKNKESNKNFNILSLFVDSIPIIENSLEEFVKVYESADSKETLLSLAADLLMKLLSEDAVIFGVYKDLITMDNIKKYIVPLFDKLYGKKIMLKVEAKKIN